MPKRCLMGLIYSSRAHGERALVIADEEAVLELGNEFRRNGKRTLASC
jgi:hypothetical protein